MAIAVALLNIISNPDTTERELIVDGTLTFSGNYPNFGDMMNLGQFDAIKSQSLPTKVEIYEMPAAGTAPSGFTYTYALGTTLANGQVVVTASASQASPGILPLVQIAVAAYPAGITGASVRFRAWFPSFV